MPSNDMLCNITVMLFVPTLQRVRSIILICHLWAFRKTDVIWFGVQLDAYLGPARVSS